VCLFPERLIDRALSASLPGAIGFRDGTICEQPEESRSGTLVAIGSSPVRQAAPRTLNLEHESTPASRRSTVWHEHNRRGRRCCFPVRRSNDPR
jgi:hypothetical protein